MKYVQDAFLFSDNDVVCEGEIRTPIDYLEKDPRPDYRLVTVVDDKWGYLFIWEKKE
jgi:hypothetical protein